MTVTQKQLIELYKSLYKYGLHELKHTDKTYFFKYVRSQFKSAEPTDYSKIELLFKVAIQTGKIHIKQQVNRVLFKKGEAFLTKKRLI